MKKLGNSLASLGLGGSSTPYSNQRPTISQINDDIKQVLSYHTLIEKMETEIQICNNQKTEKYKEIQRWTTQAQKFSQDAKKGINFYRKNALQEKSNISRLYIKQAEEDIIIYNTMIDKKLEIINQCHTKMMEKEGK